MAPTDSGRQHLFIVAAVALPLLVIAGFLLATALPRWFVDPPAYDLLFQMVDMYADTKPREAIAFRVRDGRVEATARGMAADAYVMPRALYVYEHRTGTVRKIAVTAPPLQPDQEVTLVVEELAGRRVIPEPTAPDGYALQMPPRSAPGLIGDLFGMRRTGQDLAIANRGRVEHLNLPAPLRFYDPASVGVLGWLEPAR